MCSTNSATRAAAILSPGIIGAGYYPGHSKSNVMHFAHVCHMVGRRGITK